MWESDLVPIVGAHRSSFGYYEARPSDVVAQDVLILDVRESSKLCEGRIDSAQHFSVDRDYDALAQMLPKDFVIVVVCQSGPRSKKACKRLVAMGYTEVHHLVGGMRRWHAEGHVTVSGEGWSRFSEPLPQSQGASA